MTTISIELAAECMELDVKANMPVMLSGPPGVGKSEVGDQVAHAVFGAYDKKKDAKLYKQFARYDGCPIIDLRASLRDPVDFRGLPFVDPKTGTTIWLPPSELPVIQNLEKFGPRGFLKMDELNTAAPAVINACLGIVLERRIGEHELIPGWVPVAMGNRLKDKVNVQRMSSAMKNRFAHYEVEADVEAWINWATRTQKVHPLVVAFIKFRPVLFHKMPEGEEMAFPTARAWVSVGNICDGPDRTRQHQVAARVGDNAAGEFEAFYRVWKNLPSIDQILKDPRGVHCPGYEEPAAAWAVSMALARRVKRENFANALAYATRMPKEMEVLFVTDAARRDPSLKATKAFGDWYAKNAEVII